MARPATNRDAKAVPQKPKPKPKPQRSRSNTQRTIRVRPMKEKPISVWILPTDFEEVPYRISMSLGELLRELRLSFDNFQVWVNDVLTKDPKLILQPGDEVSVGKAIEGG